MEAGDDVVHFLRHGAPVDGAVVIGNVRLHPAEQAHAEGLPRQDAVIFKEGAVRAAGHARAVVGRAQCEQALLAGGAQIFLQGAVGVAARHGVGVQVKQRLQRHCRYTSSPMA